MIPKHGVIYRYTPPSHKTDSSQPFQKKGPSPFSSNTKPQTLNKPPRIKPVPTVFPSIPKFNTTRKPPGTQPRFVPKNNPFGPARHKPPTPFGAKKPVDWNDPFAFDPFDDEPHMPPKYEAATSLKDFVPVSPAPIKPVEMHNGLPVEETPEMPLTMPTVVDSAYVDRLFGNQSVTTQTVQDSNDPNPISPIRPEPDSIKSLDVQPQIQHSTEPVSEPVVSTSTELVKTHQPPQPQEKPVNKTFSFAKLFAKKQQHKAEIKQSEAVPKTDSHNATIDTHITSAAINQPNPQSEQPAVATQPSQSEPIHAGHSTTRQAVVTQPSHTEPKQTEQPAVVTQPSQSEPIHAGHSTTRQAVVTQPSHTEPKQTEQPAVVTQPSHSEPKHPSVPTEVIKGTISHPVGDSSHHASLPGTHTDHQTPKPNPLDILKPKFKLKRTLGILFILMALYGISMPLIPKITLESTYAEILEGEEQKKQEDLLKPLPKSVPIGFNPMMAPDGKLIEPVNKEFSIVIPAVGINSPIIAGVNPLDQKSYKPALEKGVAHAKTSYLPTQEGSMYLFSHSTNYDWFVKDLNAIFYNVKNLKDGNYIIVFYKGKRYVYQYKDRKIVSPKDTSYLLPTTGKKTLILQTCWPPGSVSQRLLVFADLVDESYPTVLPQLIP